MMNTLRLCLLLIATIGCGGCAGLQQLGNQTRSFARSLKPESYVDDNPADDPGDPWIEAAGLEGRADQKRESTDDPLHLRKYFVSPRARSIERDMGFDD